MYLLQMLAVLPAAWICAAWAEGAYHRATGHDSDSILSSAALREMHRTHHDDPVDASDGEYACMLLAVAIGLAVALAARPTCPKYARGALDASMLVALVFPYVSWALHGEFHNPATPLAGQGWFDYLRARHRSHHSSGGRCNFGITSPTYDWLHSTEARATSQIYCQTSAKRRE